MEIKNLPSPLWAHFYDLNQVPRPSKHEERVRAFMKDFGKSLNLETLEDEVDNILIRKPATPGMENRKTVVLQSHLDMVHQKNSGVEFNFDTDAIQMYIDGDWIKAKGTTLGADNGIGVAASMAILAATDVEHGPIEALFTVDEETGMTGAFGLKPGFVTGEVMLNMDSEEEGELCISCAGGLDTNIHLHYAPESLSAGYAGFEVWVKGLKGGHSGMDIALGLGNANKLLSRLLYGSHAKFGLRLGSMNGGTARNAIPRECVAVVAIPTEEVTAFRHHAAELSAIFRHEFEQTDPGVMIELNERSCPEAVLPAATQDKLLATMYAHFSGPYRMSHSVDGLVETSSNFSKVHIADGKLEINCLSRSSLESAKFDIAAQLEALWSLCGAKIEHTGSYPGWQPNPESAILHVAKEVHKQVMGYEPHIQAIHAGLECGIIGSVYPQLDMVSFGPNVRGAHSPDERVQISSVSKFWDYLLALLKAIPVK